LPKLLKEKIKKCGGQHGHGPAISEHPDHQPSLRPAPQEEGYHSRKSHQTKVIRTGQPVHHTTTGQVMPRMSLKGRKKTRSEEKNDNELGMSFHSKLELD
jgi:hypothetical protein